MDDKYLRAYLAEMIGTFALVFVSAGAVCVVTRIPGGLTNWSVSVALAAAFIYTAGLAVTLPVSGGYLNPAFTIMLWVFKKMDGGKATALILVQLLGAALAGLALRYMLPLPDDVVRESRLGTPHLQLIFFNTAGTNLGAILKGVGVELLLTFIPAFILFGLAFDPRAPRGTTRLAGLWLGLVLGAVTIVGLPMTGAAVNPARWFGPVMAEMTTILRSQHPFDDHAVYWIGPIAGALLAGWVYSTLVLPSEEEQAMGAQTKSGSAAAGTSSTLFRARK